MDKRALKVLLIMIACVLLVVSAVFVFVEHSHSEFFTGFLYGAIGVGFFVVMAKILSLIQREGKQDD
jgi:apolipoprotein N-acyltransferase